MVVDDQDVGDSGHNDESIEWLNEGCERRRCVVIRDAEEETDHSGGRVGGNQFVTNQERWLRLWFVDWKPARLPSVSVDDLWCSRTATTLTLCEKLQRWLGRLFWQLGTLSGQWLAQCVFVFWNQNDLYLILELFYFLLLSHRLLV